MNLNSVGFKNGSITLDGPRGIYYSGQVVSGKIEFELNQPLTFSAINVVYHGGASVLWTEPQTEMYSGVKRYTQVEYKAYEEYFNTVQCVCGGDGTSVLHQGSHSIPFEFQIPFTVPSSFSSPLGNVTYKVSAYLEAPPIREELERTFEVVAPLDLNKDESGDAQQPIEMQFEEIYSCCCSTQPISIGVKLPVSGYCPGQPIPITIDAQNNSSTEISKIIFQLIMKERYHSRNPVSEYTPPEKLLATMKKGPIMSNTKRVYTFEMPVPEMIAPHLDNCGIIDLGFFFKVIIKLSGCNDDMEDESEIYIGLIPLEITTRGNRYVHPLSHSLPDDPIPDPNSAPNFTSLPPYMSGGMGTEHKSSATNLLNASNSTPYGSKSNMSTSTVHSINARTSPHSPYLMPSAPYLVQEKPKSYEIGFKI
ncbi:unnamed protein product [Parnassius mnemosyne]|uniref:Arrestin C-terminal-like domain-containing protein n=1 Tax=Parnassius mnemosyne TaxID=213953 RepID=A0AAV1KCH2_9NEOP